MSDQLEFYRETEREYWATAEGLKDEEAVLIERFLDPAKSTVDAGTGGGRIPRSMAAAGFTGLTGFDFAPELIDAARAADKSGAVEWNVADATALPYETASFGQATYLQQIVSAMDARDARVACVQECFRVLEPGGISLFSFLSLESRLASRGQRAFVSYLRALRALRRDPRPHSSMPRLKLRGKPAPGALRDRGPFNWWYRAEEAELDLTRAGFEVLAVAFGPDVLAGSFSDSAAAALAAGPRDILYVVAKKPEPSSVG